MRKRSILLAGAGLLSVVTVAYGANFFRTPTGEEVPATVQMCIDGSEQAVPCTESSGGTGGGGPATIANGADVAEGAKADAAFTGGATGSVIAILKGIYAAVGSSIPGGTATIGSLNPLVGTFTDKSGAVTAGGTPQTLAAVNATRLRIIIQNPCTAAAQNIATAENLFINWTSNASPTAGGSLELLPCGSYDSGNGPVSTELISVVGATINHKYSAKEM